jgi:hypothetical protein
MHPLILIIIAVVLAPLVVTVYFLPSYVAWRRDHKNTPAILALNALLGWTLVGWTVALVWALLADQERDEPAAPTRLVAVCSYCHHVNPLPAALVGKPLACGSCGGSFTATPRARQTAS